MKQKARDEQYCAFLANIIEKHQRLRPDGSIEWSKAFGELLELRNKYIDLAIEEERKRIVEEMRNVILWKRSCRSHEPENCNICKGRQEAINSINLITNPKE